jgi:hypothetical protein
VSFFCLQPVSLVGERQIGVIHSDNADLKTNAVPGFQKRISAYQEACFPSQLSDQCFPEVPTKISQAIFCYIISSVSVTDNKNEHIYDEFIHKILKFVNLKQLVLYPHVEVYRHLFHDKFRMIQLSERHAYSTS